MHTIRDIIDRQAESQPNRAYLISPDTKAEVTFGGLRDNLRLLAGRLQRLGLKSDDKVAFLMDNGLFTAQLFLAATYGGFVAVPLNVRAGVTQLSYTLEHSDARVVFVEEKYASLIKDVLAGVRHEVLVIPAGVDETIEAAGDSPALLPASAPSDAVLLMYTSGSTGLPKAGMHSHRTLLAQAQNLIESHKFTSGDRSLLVLPLYHLNAESVTLIPMLVVGGSVIVPHHFVVSKFWDWIEEYQCTWSALVPTIISQLIDYKDPKAGQRAEAFARIRFLRSSSAPLSPALHREFIDKFKLPLIQAMGSTEGGNVFSNPVPPGVNKIGSPGLPTGFEVRIVNREGADLPANEPGEILLRGPAMMEGYYKDPVTTSASLDAEGWFHTGDLAYRDDDGYFFVVGRSKELIIKGGMNIAPKQIDEVMESHPAVLEAAAVGVPDRYVGEDVVAFVVLRQGMSCDEREMLAFCEERLGHFKTPTRIHFVEDLPKGPSGKVQRLRLVEEAAKPALARSASLGKTPASTNGAAAQNGHSVGLAELKETIVKIWSELLPLAKVTPGSNFFELGGHSLLAIQSLSKLRQKVPVVLSLTEFFENATPQHLAEFALKRMADAPSAEESAPPEELAPIPLRDRASSCPLSPAQRRIWFAEKFMPEALTYNEADGFRLAGPLDLDALERAFNVVISRHELMRSTIEIDGSEASFKVHEKWPLKIKRIDLSRLPAAERKAEADRLLVTEPRLPYDLEKAPGLRVTVAKLGPEEHVLILMMHHIICDWSSEGVLWREISALYRAFLKKEEINLAPLPIQHGDYAAWQEKEFDPANFAEDLAFWKKNLEGAPELLELPADRPRPATATYRGARLRYYLSAALTDGLRQLSRKEKTSHFTLFAAALDVLLHRYTKSDDIVLGIPLADRDRPELQSMIGFMLHTQVLRTRLEPAMRFSDLVGRVQKSALDMFSHRAAPFDLVVRAAGQERSLSHSPLFQMMLIWRDRDQELGFIGLEGLKIESIQAEARTSKFDLTLMVTDGGEEIWFELEYSTDLFDESRMQRMLGHYQRLLEAIVAEPDRSVAELALLTEAERKQILVDWNETSLSVPHDKLLSDLVEDQARRVPDSVAVVFGGRQLTYRELNERANQLAHHLQKLGVGPDSLVAVCVERSLDMVVGLLGVLKAGGAYVPLDPRYPKDRLAFVLEDADAKVLLTQSSLISSMPAAQAKMVQLDADWPTIAQESTAKPKTSTHPENLAYVIYTSGSTGLPKGGGNSPPRGGEFHGLDAAKAGAEGSRCASGGDHDLLRHRRARIVPAPGDRRESSRREPRRSRRRLHSRPTVAGTQSHRAASHARHLAHAPGNQMGRRRQAEDALRRRSDAARPCRRASRQGRRALEHVRPDGDDHLVVVLAR